MRAFLFNFHFLLCLFFSQKYFNAISFFKFLIYLHIKTYLLLLLQHWNLTNQCFICTLQNNFILLIIVKLIIRRCQSSKFLYFLFQLTNRVLKFNGYSIITF
ncbi:hypothetical protein IMG5_184890 [Ichthyophthirius multifiliis]|uniref:Transmembrane protein n=1 Tax=Ichthyophthirius multifiliis TaxID=5932 RepID=G0R3E5_ICHMU|nr:hypothetical protein IMG5_184890 [Ichthyophthirius multifiliis]EGR28018.1 hypothetical protein IMG5_184890 [Ichthyophthirius multifiliis]|eukprot:XP_004027363.1 hypothetical protein IMG5_184890 [Ichthyophthirius multifiliis]